METITFRPEEALVEMSRLQDEGKKKKAVEIGRKAYNRALSDYGEDHEITNKIRFSYTMCLMNAGRRDEAKRILLVGLPIDEKNHGPRSLEVGSDLRWMGVIHWYDDEFDKAKEFLEKGLVLLDEHMEPNERLLGDTHFMLAICYAQARKHDEAVEHHMKSIGILRHYVPTRTDLVTTSYLFILSRFMDKGDLSGAEVLAKEAMDTIGSHVGSDSEAMMVLNGRMGELFYRQGNLARADTCFLNAFQAGLVYIGEEDFDPFTYIEKAIMARLLTGAYDSAEELARYAITSVPKDVLGLDRIMAHRIWALARCRFCRGDLRDATEKMERARSLFKKSVGESSTEYAMATIDLGWMVKEYGAFQRAEILMESGRNIFDNEHYGFLTELTHYYKYKQDLLIERGLYEEADEFSTFNIKMNMIHHIYAHSHPSRAKQKVSEARIFIERVDVDARSTDYAEILLRDAIREFQVIYSEGHPLIAPVLLDLCGILLHRQHYSAATQLADRVRTQLLEKCSNGHPFIARTYTIKSQIEMAKGNNRKAWELINEAITDSEALLGTHHPVVSELYLQLAEIYLDAGDPDAAIEAASWSISIDERIVGQNHPRKAQGYLSLARAALKMNNVKEAIENIKISLSMYRTLFGDKHHTVIDTASLLIDVKTSADESLDDEAVLSKLVPVSRELPRLEDEILSREMIRLIKLLGINVDENPLDELINTNPNEEIRTMVFQNRIDDAYDFLSGNISDLLSNWSWRDEYNEKMKSITKQRWERLGNESRALGLIQWHKGIMWEAEKNLARSVCAFEKIHWKYHPEMLRGRMLLARVIAIDHNNDEIMEYIKEKARNAFARGDTAYINSIYHRAVELMDEDRLDAAAVMLRETIELRDVLCDSIRDHQAKAFACYAQVQLRMDDINGAERTLEEVIKRWKLNNDDLSKIPQEVLWIKCDAMNALGKYDKVEQYLLSTIGNPEDLYFTGRIQYYLILADSNYLGGDIPAARSLLSRVRTCLDDKKNYIHEKQKLEERYLRAIEKIENT